LNNYSKVEIYILKNNGNREQAKDFYQEAFITVWQKVKNDLFIPSKEDEYNAYLYRVAKNNWIDYLRSKKYIKTTHLSFESAEEESDEQNSDNFSESVYKNAMHAFEKLGDECKQILTNFYFKKQSLKIIAKAFALNEASARNKKYRCMQRLREIVFNKN